MRRTGNRESERVFFLCELFFLVGFWGSSHCLGLGKMGAGGRDVIVGPVFGMTRRVVGSLFQGQGQSRLCVKEALLLARGER